MTKFTKERLEQYIKSPLEHGLIRSEQMEMARQLLASMEQEPVACIDRANMDYLESGAGADVWPASEAGSDDVLLYAAPQLPQPAVAEPIAWISRNKKTGDVELVEPHEVATNQEYWTDGFPVYGTPISAPLPPEMSSEMMRAVQLNSELGAYATANLTGAYDMFAEFWKVACRAAMLQGAEPVSHGDELPMDYLQGHKDGLEWAARLAEANHPQTGDWLYDDPLELAKAIRKGPDMPTAPVQGWIPCSERMPEEIGRYWCYVEEQNSLGKSHYQWNCSWNGDRWWVESENGGRVTHWMPLQEPPKQTAES